jgi:phage terminase large subunit GpA-like protein
LLHGDQTIDPQGTVQGDPPRTETLGFRWSAVNNQFITAGNLGADEWKASRAPDEENAEREMRQFVWCLPAASTKWEYVSLAAQEIVSRTLELRRGAVPEGTQFLTAAIDLGKYLAHWIAVAWRPGASGHILDYGRLEVASADLGVEQALMVTLRQFQEVCAVGWPRMGIEKLNQSPDMAFVDAGYMAPVVYAFCREAGRKFTPSFGRGVAQQRAQWYSRPTQTGSVVRHIGEGFHLNELRTEQLIMAEVDADHWKSWVHERLKTPLGTPGAMTLFKGAPQEHFSLAKHLTAESKVEEFVAGKGMVARWERLQRQNHWFDALYNACAAGHLVGVRLIVSVPQPAPPPAEKPAGRPWVDLSRWKGIRGRR